MLIFCSGPLSFLSPSVARRAQRVSLMLSPFISLLACGQYIWSLGDKEGHVFSTITPSLGHNNTGSNIVIVMINFTFVFKVYGWEPVTCFDKFPPQWGNVADIAFSSEQMVSCCPF